MSFLYEHEWLLLLISEGVTWIVGVLFIILRYWLKLKQISQWCLISVIILNLFQVILAGIDYYYTGKTSFFQVVIILLVIYGSTLGSADFARLDTYIQRKISRELITDGKKEFRSYIQYRRQLFLVHTIAFVLIHIIWFLMDSNPGNTSLGFRLFNQWLDQPHLGFFYTPHFNIISYVWKIIYLFELGVYITYTFYWYVRCVKDA